MIQDRIDESTLVYINEDGAKKWTSVYTLMKPLPSIGTSIRFDQLRTYGYDTAETGNITLDLTGGVKEGMTQIVIHNHSQEPTFGPEFIILSGSYTTDVDNYIALHAIKKNVILVSISQEQE